MGLRHIAILGPKPKYIDSIESLKNAINLNKSEENQLLVLMFTKGKEVKCVEQLPLHSISIKDLIAKNVKFNIDDKGNFIKKIEDENNCSKIAVYIMVCRKRFRKML